MGKKFGLKFKITAYFIITIVLTIVICSFVINFYIKDQIYDLKKSDFEFIAEGYGEELSQVFSGPKDVADKIASRNEIQEYFENEDSLIQQADTLKILEDYLINYKYAVVYLMNKEGETIVSTDSTFVGNNYGYREYFQEAIFENQGTEMAIGKTSGEPGYYFSRAVKSENGESLLGVVVVKMNPVIIEEAIDKHTTGGIEVMLVDEYGIVVYSANSDKRYRSLQVLISEEKEEASVEDRFPGKEIHSLGYDKVAEFLGTGEPHSLEIYNKTNKVSRIVTIDPIENFPFYILVDTSTEDVNQKVSQILYWLIVFILLPISLIMFLFIYLLGKSFKPLKVLVKTVEDISKGDLEKRAQINSGDEIQELSEVFNEMMEEIAKSKKEVDKKVEERTAELEKINRHMTKRELKMIDLKKENEELKKEIKKSLTKK